MKRSKETSDARGQSKARRKLLPVLAALLALSGCSIHLGAASNHVPPILGAPVTDNHTPYSRCLSGLAVLPGNHRPVIAVGDIRDKTGQMLPTGYSDSTLLTQGVTEMVISALYKTRKVSLAERLDLVVPLTEQQFTKMGLLPSAPELSPIPINFVILGALTELNHNIVSDGARLFVRNAGGGIRRAVINVGLDLRVVEYRTLRTVYATSLQKQVVGYEYEAGVFRFFGNQLVDFDAGQIRNEPLQVGVRSVVEMAILQVMTEGFGLPIPDGCDLVKVDPASGELNKENPQGTVILGG
ncbi:MAG: curli production assembly/transport component CsgG [Halomonas sp.]|uniref:CsgG/HfaB family protein n=1 Tax=Halomonas sp. TaxID=1486246 RepID=UPI001A0352B2|nr:CsgG/HfaB family protein [Halomonas sp.]MBE0488300.1 curli production assembly/transport component CsgG [Halomonas sp.]